jgi:hypothetical protein
VPGSKDWDAAKIFQNASDALSLFTLGAQTQILYILYHGVSHVSDVHLTFFDLSFCFSGSLVCSLLLDLYCHTLEDTPGCLLPAVCFMPYFISPAEPTVIY